MKWAFVDSCGPGVVSKAQANGRVSRALNKLQSVAMGGHNPRVHKPVMASSAAVSITSEDQ
jgi:hypothetical protein